MQPAIYIKRTLLTVILVFSMALVSNAQDGFGDPPVNDDAPIDGGLSLLVAAGVGYGVKKVHARKKKTIIEE